MGGDAPLSAWVLGRAVLVVAATFGVGTGGWGARVISGDSLTELMSSDVKTRRFIQLETFLPSFQCVWCLEGYSMEERTSCRGSWSEPPRIRAGIRPVTWRIWEVKTITSKEKDELVAKQVGSFLKASHRWELQLVVIIFW